MRASRRVIVGRGRTPRAPGAAIAHRSLGAMRMAPSDALLHRSSMQPRRSVRTIAGMSGAVACRLVLAITLLVAPGCSSTAVFSLAVGARGTLPTWNGPCGPDGRRGDSVALVGDGYVAERTGVTELACRDGRLRLDVRDVTTLEIDGPATIGSAWVTYRIVASARDGRPLDLGEAEVAWSIPDGIERDGACHGDVLPACDPPSMVRLRARGNGDAEIRANLGSTGARRSVTLGR